MNYQTPLMNSTALKFRLVKLALIEKGKEEVLFGQVVQSSAYQLPLRKIYNVKYCVITCIKLPVMSLDPIRDIPIWIS